MILPPFRAEDYNQEVHAQTYRCIAENTFGKIISRDVHVRAGREEHFFTIILAEIFQKKRKPSFKIKNSIAMSCFFNLPNLFFTLIIFNENMSLIVVAHMVVLLFKFTKLFLLYKSPILGGRALQYF